MMPISQSYVIFKRTIGFHNEILVIRRDRGIRYMKFKRRRLANIELIPPINVDHAGLNLMVAIV